MRRYWSRVALLVTIFILEADRSSDATLPPDTQGHPDGFWFGTQSLLCMTSKAVGPLPRLVRKRSASTSSEPSTPERSGLRYIHRLIYYNGTVFEWGTGVRGYYMGPTPSVTDCPVSWEPSPAGRGHCPVEALANYTRLYRSRFGPYHLLTNNCHHFANRLSALLSDPGCRVPSTAADEAGDDRGEAADGIVSIVERSLWRAISFVLSYVDPLLGGV